MKIIFKELLYNKKKYILVELIIVLLMFMVLFLSGLVNGLGRAVSSSIELMNAKYYMISDSAENIITVSNIDTDTYTYAKDNLSDVTTLDIHRMFIQKQDSDTKINITYFAIEPNSFIEPKVFSGTKLSNSAVENGIVLDDDFKYEGINIGDIIIDSATKLELKVIGFTKDQMYGHTSVGFISRDLYYQMNKILNPMYQLSYHALVTNDSNVLKLNINNIDVVSKNNIITNIPSYSAEHTTITMVIWLLVVISSVIIGVFYFILTMQKEKQYAVMKALGFGMGKISIIIICQVFTVAFVGALISNILNLTMASFLPETMPYYLKGLDALGVSIAFVVISILSSLLSINRIRRVLPMSVIGGEQ